MITVPNFKAEIDIETSRNSTKFLEKIESEMSFKSDYSGDLIAFDWVSEIEHACPFVDIIVRNPKNMLIQEENVLKIEKSKKTNVESVKNLARHTEYINKYNKQTDDIEPSKILDIRNEETYNIYENRFLYTMIHQLERFVLTKEELLDNFEINNHKLLEYAGNTVTTLEKVNIELKVTSESLPTDKIDENLTEQLKEIKARLKRIKEYINSWYRSEMMRSLEHAHVPFINPPIKKTNLILKNPNFQVAVQLWEFIQKYDMENQEDEKENLNEKGGDILKKFLDHSFLIDYFVMDSMAKSKKEQKQNMAKCALVLLTEEIHRIVELLSSIGVNITDEELLKMIAKELKNDKAERLVGVDDVRKKFKSAMEEYLERTQNYL